MQVDFAFGKSGLPVNLPDGPRYQVLEARGAAPLSDSAAALEDATIRLAALRS
jgi:lactate racemase